MLLSSANLLQAAPDVNSFVDGKWTKFSTLNHKKANGLVITLCYPVGWVSKEGEKPHIVQKFVSDGGKGSETAMILIKEMPPLPADVKPTEEDLKEFFSEDALKTMAPTGAKIFVAKQTKIEGLIGGTVEYSANGERLGVTIEQRSIMYCFIYDNKFVSVSFTVSGLPNAKTTAEDHMKEFRPLFLAMANKISLSDRWK